MNQHAYELLPRLLYCTLVGQDDDGDLEFYGTFKQWHDVARLEEKLLNQ